MTYPKTAEDLAQAIAEDLEPGSYVNLGIGQPTLVANYISPDKGIVLHTENGMLGMGPEATGDDIDYDLLNAGKFPITERPGASYFDHAESFAMIRGRHLDVCVLGAFQVSERGDLANWKTRDPAAIPGVGGAMDLALGAKQVWVMMRLLTKTGESKLLRDCTYPLTGLACVTRVYTDMAVFGISPQGVTVLDSFGQSLASIQELTDVPLLAGPTVL